MSELNGGFKFTAQPYWPDGSNGGLDYGYDYFTSKEGMTMMVETYLYHRVFITL